MADSLAATIKASLQWAFTETLDLSAISDAATLSFSKSTTDGTSADQADKVWHDTRTIAGTTADDLDLTALTNNIFGSTVTINFAKVKAILIVNQSTTAGEELYLDSSVAASILTPFAGNATSKVEIGADSPLLLCSKKDGWAVTNTTADILRVYNPNAGSVTYKIAIIGTSA